MMKRVCLVLMVSCQPAPTTTTSSTPAVSVAPVSAQPDPPSGEPRASSAAPAPSAAALFTYEESGDRIDFFPPSSTKLIRKDGTGCQGDLPENGNMYSGKEVETAFSHPDVQGALESHQTYGAPLEGSLRASAHPGSITWAKSCRACLPEPQGVADLHRMLEVVMRNRRAVCAP